VSQKPLVDGTLYGMELCGRCNVPVYDLTEARDREKVRRKVGKPERPPSWERYQPPWQVRRDKLGVSREYPRKGSPWE
jgi:hypothetical protein